MEVLPVLDLLLRAFFKYANKITLRVLYSIINPLPIQSSNFAGPVNSIVILVLKMGLILEIIEAINYYAKHHV